MFFIFDIHLYFINKSRVNIKFLEQDCFSNEIIKDYNYEILIVSKYCSYMFLVDALLRLNIN
jgi:hypothetical protein